MKTTIVLVQALLNTYLEAYRKSDHHDFARTMRSEIAQLLGRLEISAEKQGKAEGHIMQYVWELRLVKAGPVLRRGTAISFSEALQQILKFKASRKVGSEANHLEIVVY